MGWPMGRHILLTPTMRMSRQLHEDVHEDEGCVGRDLAASLAELL